MVRGTVVASVDARMQVIPGAAPPAADVDVVLGGQTFTMPTTVARVLLERLADSVTSAERYSRAETHRLALRRQQADRAIRQRAQAAPRVERRR